MLRKVYVSSKCVSSLCGQGRRLLSRSNVGIIFKGQQLKVKPSQKNKLESSVQPSYATWKNWDVCLYIRLKVTHMYTVIFYLSVKKEIGKMNTKLAFSINECFEEILRLLKIKSGKNSSVNIILKLFFLFGK